ncbi:MAG: hypothetical protein NTV22_05030 [bacterium]|nr:hypothetical protein [bacterium]
MATFIGCSRSSLEPAALHVETQVLSNSANDGQSTRASSAHLTDTIAASNIIGGMLVEFAAYADLFLAVKTQEEENIDFTALSNLLSKADFNVCRDIMYEFGGREEYYGQHFAALIAFTRATTAQQRIQAMLACVTASMLMGDYDACLSELAMTSIEATVKNSNYMYQQLSFKMDVYSAQGNYTAAIDAAMKALTIADQAAPFAKPNTLFQLGNLYVNANDPSNARKTFTEFLALDIHTYTLGVANANHAKCVIAEIDSGTWQKRRVPTEAEQIAQKRRQGMSLNTLLSEVRRDMPPPTTPTRQHMLNVKLSRIEKLYTSGMN